MNKSIGRLLQNTGTLMTSHSKSIGINMELDHLSHNSGHSSAFHKIFGGGSVGIFAHSSRRPSVRSGLDVGYEGLTHNSHSSSSQKCLVGLRSCLSADQSRSSTPKSPNHVFMDFALCAGAQSCWIRKGFSQNCSRKV